MFRKIKISMNFEEINSYQVTEARPFLHNTKISEIDLKFKGNYY